MYVVGVHAEGETLKVALLSKVKNKIHIEWTQSLSKDVYREGLKNRELGQGGSPDFLSGASEDRKYGGKPTLAKPDFSATSGIKLLDILGEKNVTLVSGLEPLNMVRRAISLKLKNERAILKALPFQVESLIPYPSEEMILIPRLHPVDNKTTEVVLFATTKSHLKTHLSEMQAWNINSDVVSATGVALARWGFWQYPDKKNLCLMQSGCCVVFSEEKIEILQAYENVERTKAYVLTKFPEAHFLPVIDEYAIAIGLGLDALKNGLQFQQEEFSSQKMIERKTKWKQYYIAACLTLAFSIAGIGFYKVNLLKNQLKERLNHSLGASSLPLKERVLNLETELLSYTKSFPLVPTTPLVTDTLAWLSCKKQEIDIIRFHYTLVKYPKLGEKLEPYQVKIDLEFNAPSPSVAREFHDSLLKNDPLVNTKQEVTWNISQNLYKTSFYLRNL